jgi:hypothetical protein
MHQVFGGTYQGNHVSDYWGTYQGNHLSGYWEEHIKVIMCQFIGGINNLMHGYLDMFPQ